MLFPRELAMLQTCQYVELSLAHALVRGRGACSAPRCGVSNNKPLQKQHLRRKGGPVSAPGKAAEPKHSSQAAPAPPVSLPAMPGCAGEVACPDSGQPCPRAGNAPTDPACQATATTGPWSARTPRALFQPCRRRTHTHRERGEHLHSL